VALLAQPGWAPAIVAFGLLLLLFPDGRLPAARWRWLVRAYLAVAAVWVTGAVVITVGALASHHVRVDSGGNLLQLNGNTPRLRVVEPGPEPVLPAAAHLLAGLAGR
jgi:hypothetical protein